MRKCVWVRPELVAQIEFLEWTDSDHLRHSKFVGLRENKDPGLTQSSSGWGHFLSRVIITVRKCPWLKILKFFRLIFRLKRLCYTLISVSVQRRKSEFIIDVANSHS